MTLTVRPALASLAAALLVGLYLPAIATAADSAESKSSPAAGNAAGHAAEMQQLMGEGAREMQGMALSGDMDRDFATMMRRHHRQGLKMAEMELAHGKDPKMKAMAKKIHDTQQKEIKQFDQWLKNKGQ